MNNNMYNNYGGFNFKVHSELTCRATGQGSFFSRKGAMVAYEGQFKFSKVLLDPNNTGVVGAVVNNLTRKITGENMEIMKVDGAGSCFLADDAQHVTVLGLNPGEFVCVESENLLAFTGDCKYGVKMIGTGVISQKGLFTTKITGQSNASQVAVKTDGNPIILQVGNEPICVDPDAIVCWTGAEPHLKLDLNWKTLIGQTSGESYMLEFKEPGQTVIIQPKERNSNISLKDHNRPNTQTCPTFGGSNQSLGSMMNNSPLGNHGGQMNVGGIANAAKNILNNLQ